MQAGLLRPSRVGGFTLIEIMTALAIVVVLVGLTLGALSQLQSQASRRAFTTDLAADLALARNRAIARQRTQVIVIDATAGANAVFGYFHLEDTGNRIYSSADVAALLVGFDPSTPSTAPVPYTVQALESASQSTSPFYLSTTAWGGALPFPFAAVSQDTSGGCSFCTSGVGALAFLPNGKAVFSNGNAAGGLIAVQGRGGTGASSMSALLISTSSLVQTLVR
jgi:prepilin-type N-terminal cleavage/methylation domain-containing protein